MIQRVILVFALGLLALPGARLAGQATPEAKPCDAKPDWFLQVSKPDSGWDTGFVGRAHKLGHEAPALTAKPGFEGVHEAEYAARQKYFKWIELVAYPCEHRVSLKTQRLLIGHVYAFTKNGKTFALAVQGNCGNLVKGEWHAAGCDTGILLIDTTGSGKFDSLRIGRSAPDAVPAWVDK
jgi:hypothetical protein